MRTSLSFWPNAARTAHRAGFTLVELLVIVALIAMLAFLQLPALAGAKGRTKVAQCSSNLRQFALAMQIYGGDYSSQLPRTFTGTWAWDVDWDTGSLLSRYGAPAKMLYCPGTAPRFSEADNLNLYNWFPGNSRVLGYGLTFAGTASLILTNENRTLTPQSTSLGTTLLPPPIPSQRVLFADATISSPGQNNESLRSTYNYTEIGGGYVKRFLSPHLLGNIPAGGNLAMLDGCVEWRNFQDMHVRTEGSSPVFWW